MSEGDYIIITSVMIPEDTESTLEKLDNFEEEIIMFLDEYLPVGAPFMLGKRICQALIRRDIA